MIPAHYQPVMPYVVVNDTDGFIDFISAVFGAEEKLRVNRDDGSLMHGEYILNGGTIMLGQASDEWKPFPNSMFLVVKEVAELYRKAAENGAIGNQDPADRGYGLAAGFMDRWGNQWWLNDPESRTE